MKREKPMNRKPAKPSPPASWNQPGALNREIQNKIGDQLRAMHDDIVKQGVPDRFVDLLSRLDASKEDKGD